MTELRDMLPALTRPLLGVDLETTGTNVERSRIVEIGLEIMLPGQPTREYRTLVNPGIPIPHVATYGNGKTFEGHGITDEMVQDAPPFERLADNLLRGFVGADFAGYNVRFDLKLFRAEFARARRAWHYEDARVIDGFRLWQVAEARSLEDAIKRWLGGQAREVEGERGKAHCALWDVVNSTRIIAAQLEQVASLPRDIAALHELCAPGWYDADGKLQWRDGELQFTFGKCRGLSLIDVARTDVGYLKFVLRGDFTAKVKDACRNALQGIFPSPPVVMEDTLDPDHRPAEDC